MLEILARLSQIITICSVVEPYFADALWPRPQICLRRAKAASLHGAVRSWQHLRRCSEGFCFCTSTTVWKSRANTVTSFQKSLLHASSLCQENKKNHIQNQWQQNVSSRPGVPILFKCPLLTRNALLNLENNDQVCLLENLWFWEPRTWGRGSQLAWAGNSPTEYELMVHLRAALLPVTEAPTRAGLRLQHVSDTIQFARWQSLQ